jgi:aminobutyraldehyde dehydrogenase
MSITAGGKSLAGNDDYGLASSVWTSDTSKGPGDSRTTSFRLHLGQHSLYAGERNAHTDLTASGYGKDLSIYALEGYTVARHVMVKL